MFLAVTLFLYVTIPLVLCLALSEKGGSSR